MKKSELFKVVSINLFFIFLAVLGGELLLRIRLNGRFDASKPLKSINSIVRALANSKGDLNIQSNSLRKAYPYLMFKGLPNALDHNNLGYRIVDPITRNTINIAFFGGSTGYQGSPPIVNLLTQKLNSTKDATQYAPLNFSVVSSNHNQHLHSLVENYTQYPMDMIVFYGGYNETIQTAFYDPRPGFPFNFRVRNEMSPEEMLLTKHLLIYREKEKILSKLGFSLEDADKFFNKPPLIKPFTSNWNQAIVENYIQTIDTSRLLSKSLTTGRCKTPFLFIYQPYQMSEEQGVPESYRNQVHNKIKYYVISSDNGIDLSDLFNERIGEYTDIVHLTQSGRKFVAQKILESNIFKDAIQSCNK